MTSVASAQGSRTYRWLLVLPFVWQVALVPVVNDVSFAPLHIPFPMIWQLLGVVFTTVVISRRLPAGPKVRCGRRGSGIPGRHQQFRR
jgi:hypothetical protein